MKFYFISTWQHILFGEIVVAQKVMYERFGDDFLVHFVSKGFPAAHCSQDLAEQYCQKLQVENVALGRYTIIRTNVYYFIYKFSLLIWQTVLVKIKTWKLSFEVGETYRTKTSLRKTFLYMLLKQDKPRSDRNLHICTNFAFLLVMLFCRAMISRH